MPEITEIENVWAIPEAPDEGETGTERAQIFNAHMELITWWMDDFMPKAVGLQAWGDHIRPFHLMTDKMVVEGDPSGKEKVLVTCTSEAFAILVYANCRDKWIAEFKYKKGKKGRVDLPKYVKDDPTTHVYQNRFSSSRTGQQIGGGWSADGLNYFESALADVQKFRQEEEQRDFERYKLVRDFIKAIHTDKLGGSEEPNSKKRKATSQEVTGVEEPTVDLTILDE